VSSYHFLFEAAPCSSPCSACFEWLDAFDSTLRTYRSVQPTDFAICAWFISRVLNKSKMSILLGNLPRNSSRWTDGERSCETSMRGRPHSPENRNFLLESSGSFVLFGDNFQFGAATQKLFLPSWAARAGQWGHPVTKISNFKFCFLDRTSGERYQCIIPFYGSRDCRRILLSR